MTTTNVQVPDSLITKKKILENKNNSRNKGQDSQNRTTNNTTVLVDISSQLSLNAIDETPGNDKDNSIKKEVLQLNVIAFMLNIKRWQAREWAGEEAGE